MILIDFLQEFRKIVKKTDTDFIDFGGVDRGPEAGNLHPEPYFWNFWNFTFLCCSVRLTGDNKIM